MSRRLFFLLLSGWIMLLLSGCSDHAEATNLPVVPDYSQTEYWFEGGDTDEMAYDVFYIVPTCVFDWQDAEGNICHWMDPDNPSHRASVDGPTKPTSTPPITAKSPSNRGPKASRRSTRGLKRHTQTSHRPFTITCCTSTRGDRSFSRDTAKAGKRSLNCCAVRWMTRPTTE